MISASALLRGLAAGFFAAAIAYEAICFYGFPRDINAPSILAFQAAILAFGAYAMFCPSPRGARHPLALTALFVMALALFLPFAFTYASFGTRDVESILITMNENQLADMTGVALDSFAGDMTEHAVAITAALGTIWFLLRHVAGFGVMLVGLVAWMAIASPISLFVYRLAVPNPAFARIVPERDVVEPEIVDRPDRKKNLVILYVESLERTYRDMPLTAPLFAPLARIEDAGISARGIGGLEGTNFSAGGMVATQCGLPLYPRGMLHVGATGLHNPDAEVDFAGFMPHTTCLGDILRQEGYVASYLNGSDLRLFSLGEFFGSHGYDRLLGLESFPNHETEARKNIWGVNDSVLFEHAKRELHALVAQDRPFLLALLTVNTHGPDGIDDDGCETPDNSPNPLGTAIHCTGVQVQDLIDEIGRMGIADDTIIAVMSDHIAMKNSFSRELKAHVADGGKRNNLFTLIGAGAPRVIERQATMIDVYPTLVEALGYSLADGRANMGRSLFSDQPNLTETIGHAELNEALDGNHDLQKYLWAQHGATDLHASR
ncbi:MAG: sulfatase-like hydrolase/transferase [Paracoccaceae bacterium]